MKNNNRTNWYLCSISEIWLYGNGSRGAGIYKEDDAYYSSIVHPCTITIIGGGPYSTFNEAAEICEQLLKEMDKNYAEEETKA